MVPRCGLWSQLGYLVNKVEIPPAVMRDLEREIPMPSCSASLSHAYIYNSGLVIKHLHDYTVQKVLEFSLLSLSLSLSLCLAISRDII